MLPPDAMPDVLRADYQPVSAKMDVERPRRDLRRPRPARPSAGSLAAAARGPVRAALAWPTCLTALSLTATTRTGSSAGPRRVQPMA